MMRGTVDVLLPDSGQEKDNLWTHHFVGCENAILFFKQRAALNKIIITNESRSMIEVEQSLKAGTIKGFKRCRRISTFLISHSRRGTENH